MYGWKNLIGERSALDRKVKFVTQINEIRSSSKREKCSSSNFSNSGNLCMKIYSVKCVFRGKPMDRINLDEIENIVEVLLSAHR